MNEFENWDDDELRAELERLQAIHRVSRPYRVEED